MALSLSLLQLAGWLSLSGPSGMARALAPASATPPARLAPLLLADRSTSFPLRREGGGTRAACASRLVAHLVPEAGVLDPGVPPLIGLVEGETAQPVPLVVRLGARSWPVALQPKASVRLFQLPPGALEGLWESFPACEGSQDPVAPPARSLLRKAEAGAAEGTNQQALARLWRHCGSAVATEEVLRDWAYPHLASQLPAVLPVVCQLLPSSP